MANTYKQHLETLLLADTRLVDEQGELKGNIIKDLANKLDETLIETLLQDEKTREKFFLKIKDVYVFKTNDFKFYLEQNSIDNSFTNYANQIGLTLNGKFLKDNTDVVLDFPYKDCILEGGQSTEEGLDTYFEFDEETNDYEEKQAKRKEIFYNTVVAKDEIDRLLEPKAFENITKYDTNGSHKPTGFIRDETINKERGLPPDTITDNLIIKGNNLLALHTLKEEFKGKVKLIYIDPPYYFTENKDGDSFSYNTNFKLSTWIVFMRNRLLEAKELLHSKGVLMVQIDDDGQAYLKNMLDDIFVGCFLNTVIVKAKATSGASGGGEDKKIKKNTEYIHIYKASDLFDKFNDQFIEIELNKYINDIKSDGKSFSYSSVLIDEGKKEYFNSTVDGRGDEIKIYKHTGYDIKTVSQISKIEKISIDEVYYKYIDRVFTTENAQTSIRDRVIEATDNDDNLYTIEYVPISGKNKGVMTNVSFIGKTKRLVSYLKNSCDIGNNKIYKKLKLGTLWDDMSWSSVFMEGGVKLKNGKKPESLIERIIKMTTDNEKDIVLDYHLGSGTTAAVAHKLGNQYIGLEQLDYGENDSVKRLENVINGDQSGISKSVNWQGGGSFVYLELAKNNQNAINKIQECSSYNELLALFDELYSKYFMHYNVKIKHFKEVVAKEENFINLPLDKQKEMLCRMLDNNQLYVNRDEMEADNYGLSPEDITLTKDFYQQK